MMSLSKRLRPRVSSARDLGIVTHSLRPSTNMSSLRQSITLRMTIKTFHTDMNWEPRRFWSMLSLAICAKERLTLV
jgi:hypothetical protein